MRPPKNKIRKLINWFLLIGLSLPPHLQAYVYDSQKLLEAQKFATHLELRKAIHEFIQSYEENLKSKAIQKNMESGISLALMKAWEGNFDEALKLITELGKVDEKNQKNMLDAGTIKNITRQLEETVTLLEVQPNFDRDFNNLYKVEVMAEFDVSYVTRKKGFKKALSGHKTVIVNLMKLMEAIKLNVQGEPMIGINPIVPEVNIVTLQSKSSSGSGGVGISGGEISVGKNRFYVPDIGIGGDFSSSRSRVSWDEKIYLPVKNVGGFIKILDQRSKSGEGSIRTFLGGIEKSFSRSSTREQHPMRTDEAEALKRILISSDKELGKIDSEYADSRVATFQIFEPHFKSWHLNDVKDSSIPQFLKNELEFAKQSFENHKTQSKKNYYNLLQEFKNHMEANYSRTRMGSVYRTNSIDKDIVIGLFHTYELFRLKGVLSDDQRMSLKLSFDATGGRIDSLDDQFSGLLALSSGYGQGEMKSTNKLLEAQKEETVSMYTSAEKSITELAKYNSIDGIENMVKEIQEKSENPHQVLLSVLLNLYKDGHIEAMKKIVSNIAEEKKSEANRVTTLFNENIEALNESIDSIKIDEYYLRAKLETLFSNVWTKLGELKRNIELEYNKFLRQPQTLVGNALINALNDYNSVMVRLHNSAFKWQIPGEPKIIYQKSHRDEKEVTILGKEYPNAKDFIAYILVEKEEDFNKYKPLEDVMPKRASSFQIKISESDVHQAFRKKDF